MTVQPPRVKVKKGQDAVFRCDVTEDGVKVSPGKFAIRWATSGADGVNDAVSGRDGPVSGVISGNDGVFGFESGNNEINAGFDASGDNDADDDTRVDEEIGGSASLVTFNDTLVISGVDENVEGDVTCLVIKRREEEEEEDEGITQYVGRASARLDVIGESHAD